MAPSSSHALLLLLHDDLSNNGFKEPKNVFLISGGRPRRSKQGARLYNIATSGLSRHSSLSLTGER